MGIVTTWTCDRCGAAQNTNKQMWNVAVHLNHCSSEPPQYSTGKHSVVWCRQCVADVGIAFPAERQDQTAPQSTIEDMIREIVQGALEAAAKGEGR